jgi:hypothetical protein
MKRDWAIFTTDLDSRNYARVLPLSIHGQGPPRVPKAPSSPVGRGRSAPPRHSRYGASRISGTDPQRRNPKARSEAQSILTLAAGAGNSSRSSESGTDGGMLWAERTYPECARFQVLAVSRSRRLPSQYCSRPKSPDDLQPFFNMGEVLVARSE